MSPFTSEAGAHGGLDAERIGEGRRLVLVHGFTQTHRSMAPLASRLADAFEVVIVDLPFHGPTPLPARSLEEAAAMVGERCGPASYLGYSLGGRVCLTLALQSPELVEALVLIGATPGLVTAEQRAGRRRDDEQLAELLDPKSPEAIGLEAFLERWLAGPLFAHLTSEQADLSSRETNTPEGLAGALRAMGTGTQTASHERLGELAMPVLLLAGAEDERFAAIAAEMQERIGLNATRRLIAEAGHAAFLEQPDAVAEAVRDFLTQGS